MGYDVPAEGPQALAKAIDVLAGDPERARAMGRVGRKLCEEHCNLNRYSRSLHDFFECL